MVYIMHLQLNYWEHNSNTFYRFGTRFHPVINVKDRSVVRPLSLVQTDSKLEMEDTAGLQDAVTETYHRVTNSFVYVSPNIPLVLDRHQKQPSIVTNVEGDSSVTIMEPNGMQSMNETIMMENHDENMTYLTDITTDIMSVTATTIQALIETSSMDTEITSSSVEIVTPESMKNTTAEVPVDSKAEMSTMTTWMESHIVTNDLPTSILETESMHYNESVLSEATETSTMEHTMTNIIDAAPLETTTLKHSMDSEIEITIMQALDQDLTTMMSITLMTSPTMVSTPTNEMPFQTSSSPLSEPVPTITATSSPLTSMASIMNRLPIRPTDQEPILAMDEIATEMSSTTMKTTAESRTGTKKPPRGSSGVNRPSIVAIWSSIVFGFVGWMML